MLEVELDLQVSIVICCDSILLVWVHIDGSGVMFPLLGRHARRKTQTATASSQQHNLNIHRFSDK